MQAFRHHWPQGEHYFYYHAACEAWISVSNHNTLVVVEPLIPKTDLAPNAFKWLSLADENYGAVIRK